MEKLQLRSRAKINLAIDVLCKRPDGYHEVQMIMQQIDLFDNITIISHKEPDIRIITDCPFIPKDATNIAYEAAKLIKDNFNISQGLDIYIEKKIPVAAGLAGGSSNAAAVLIGLNKLWQLNLSTKDLIEIGSKIGADVPFCILGGAAVAEGIGEKLTPIEGLNNVWIVISKPTVSVPTAEVYRQLDLSKINNRPNIPYLVEAIKAGDLYVLCNHMCNVLETVTEKKYPMIKEIKKKMMEYNAVGSMMTGSGPTVFGIYKNYEKAKSAFENLSILYKQTFLVQTYSRRNEDE